MTRKTRKTGSTMKGARKSRKNTTTDVHGGDVTPVVLDPVAAVSSVAPADVVTAPVAEPTLQQDAPSQGQQADATPAPEQVVQEEQQQQEEGQQQQEEGQQQQEEGQAAAPAVVYVPRQDWDLPYDLRPGDPCIVTVGKGGERRQRYAILACKRTNDGTVVVQVDHTGTPVSGSGQTAAAPLDDTDDGLRTVSARVVLPVLSPLSGPEREILPEMWFTSETHGHDFGLTEELLGIEEGDRVARLQLLEAKGLCECDDHYEQFTFTGRGRAHFVSFTDGPDIIGYDQEQIDMGTRMDQRGNMVKTKDPVQAASAAATAPAKAAGGKGARKRKPGAKDVDKQAPEQEVQEQEVQEEQEEQEVQEQEQEEAPLPRPTSTRRGKAPAAGNGKAPAAKPGKAAPAKAAKPTAPAKAASADLEDIRRRAEAGEELARGEKAILTGSAGFERDKDLPWGEKKIAIITALQELGAVGAGNAASGADIAERAGVNTKDVRHYCYHARAGGWVDLCKVDGVPGYSFFLTAKGAKCDPEKEQQKEQQRLKTKVTTKVTTEDE